MKQEKHSSMLSRLIVGILIVGFGASSVAQAQEAGSLIEFATDTFFEFEDAGSASVEIVRSGDSSVPASVDYSINGGIAIEGVDFVGRSGTLTFASGAVSASFSVDFIDDADPEGSEPIELSLRNPSDGSALGAIDKARLFIQDNERRGTLVDWSFDGAISTRDFVSDLALLPDGRIIASGVFSRAGNPTIDRVLLFDIDGFRDRDFDMDDEVPNSRVVSLVVQPDGKVIIGGDFTQIGDVVSPGIARLNRDGTIDSGFDPGAGFDGDSRSVFEIALQEDGKILVGGVFDTFDGERSRSLVRLNANGSIDRGFDLGEGIVSNASGFSGPWVSRILPQSDGKILIGGQFTEVGGSAYRNVARLNADGSLDPSFAIGGGPTGPGASVEALALQEDGGILIGGDFTSVDGRSLNGIARLLEDGSVDPSFQAGTGVESVDPNTGFPVAGLVTDIKITPEGKILVTGNFETIDEFGRRGIGRLLPDGTLDGSFGPYFGTTYRNSEGYEEFDAVTAVAIQEDGKVVAGAIFDGENGAFPGRLLRLLERNVVENTVEFDFPSLSVAEGSEPLEVNVIRRGQSNEAFTVDYFVLGGSAHAGEDFDLVAGTLSFGALETEKAILLPIIDDAIAEDNETLILAIRNASGGVALGDPPSTMIRILDRTRPGNVDFNFANVFIPFTGDPLSFRPVTDIVIQPDRKIVVAGYFTFVNDTDRAGLVRFNLDGSIDTSFDPEAPANNIIVEFVQMGLQPNGNFIGGLRTLSQLGGRGNQITGFESNVTFATTLAVGEDGKFIVSDNLQDAATGGILDEVVRFNADGTIDSSFVPASLNDWAITSIAQADGKVVLGGFFTDVNGVAQNRVTRLKENGSRDDSFDIGLGVEGVGTPVVIALQEQPDGKILLGGEFSLVDGFPRDNLARLNADGSIDPSFDPGLGTDAWVETIALQADGKILVGGGFGLVDGIERAGFARLNPDGSLDESFDPVLFFPEDRVVTAIEVQEDGQILLGGTFTRVNGVPRIGFARINGDDADKIIPPDPEPEPIGVTTPPSLLIEALPTSGLVQLSFDAVEGAAYEIQVASRLVGAETLWQTIATLQATSERERFEDEIGGEGQSARFYRILAP